MVAAKWWWCLTEVDRLIVLILVSITTTIAPKTILLSHLTQRHHRLVTKPPIKRNAIQLQRYIRPTYKLQSKLNNLLFRLLLRTYKSMKQQFHLLIQQIRQTVLLPMRNQVVAVMMVHRQQKDLKVETQQREKKKLMRLADKLKWEFLRDFTNFCLHRPLLLLLRTMQLRIMFRVRSI